jgi:hypothetical protein
MQRFFTSTIRKDISLIILATIIMTLLVWLPHIFRLSSFFSLDFSAGFNTIYRNFDGLEYIAIAKTGYNPEQLAALPLSLSHSYYAAHFPGYAILILAFAVILGFLKSMLFVSVLFTALSAIAFYFLLRDFKLSDHPLLMSLIFLILPARWLIIHSVGSAEPVFIFFVIMALYFFMKFEEVKKSRFIWAAAGFGVLAQVTRPPAVLLFIAFGLYILWKVIVTKELTFAKRLGRAILEYLPLILMPAALILVFDWYLVAYNDFLAYFHSGDNIHLTLPPFQVFNKNQAWVGDIWLEDVIFIFLLGFYSGFLLLKKKLYPMAFFVFTYLTASIFVAHRDISRYTLPVFPFALIAFEKTLTSKEFKIALAIISLGIYLYAQNFILQNTAPIPNLEIFN